MQESEDEEEGEKPVKKRNKIVAFDVNEEEDEEGEEPPVRKPTKARRVELVDIEIAGKKYKVDKEAVAAIAALGKGNDKAVLQELKAIQDEFKRSQQVKGKKKAAEEEEEEDDDLKDADVNLFSNTKDFLKNFRAKIKKEIMDDMKKEYIRDQNSKSSWSRFYEKNKDLKDEKEIVELVLAKSEKDIGGLPVEEGMKKLADLARKELLRITTKYGGSRKSESKHVEGEGHSRKAQIILDEGEESEEEESEGEEKTPAFNSISALIKARRQSRMEAASRLNSGAEEE
ncbi:MAG: hypothetical protein L0Y56_02295 [Nitrospira sp.]|nr:hypothetical protein [Nitrospira sp.]